MLRLSSYKAALDVDRFIRCKETVRTCPATRPDTEKRRKGTLGTEGFYMMLHPKFVLGVQLNSRWNNGGAGRTRYLNV